MVSARFAGLYSCVCCPNEKAWGIWLLVMCCTGILGFCSNLGDASCFYALFPNCSGI